MDRPDFLRLYVAIVGHGRLSAAAHDSGRNRLALDDFALPEIDLYAVCPAARRSSRRVQALIDDLGRNLRPAIRSHRIDRSRLLFCRHSWIAG